MAYETMVFAEPEIEPAEELTDNATNDLSETDDGSFDPPEEESAPSSLNDEKGDTAPAVSGSPQSRGRATATAQPAAGTPPPEKPGFFTRFGQSLGLPTSRAELEEMQRREQALPWYKRIIPHQPGTDPNVAATLLLGPGAEMARNMLVDYGKTAVKGVKEGAAQAYETGQQLGRGEISGKQATGKAADAGLHMFLQAVPIIGPAIETAGNDIGPMPEGHIFYNPQGNYRGAAGGLTGVVGQIAAPELMRRGGAAIRGIPREVPPRLTPGVPEPSLPPEGIGNRILESSRAGVTEPPVETGIPETEPPAGIGNRILQSSAPESGVAAPAAEAAIRPPVAAGDAGVEAGQIPPGVVDAQNPGTGPVVADGQTVRVVPELADDASQTQSQAQGMGYKEYKGKLPEGFQANHLNQDAAFKSKISSSEGVAVPLEGNVFTDAGSPHYKFHRVLEDFWDQFRDDGPRKGELPTNAEYDTALRRALKEAGFDEAEVQRLGDKARQQRLDYGLKDLDKVPNRPGRFMRSSNRPARSAAGAPGK